ncbi:hypothetical protein ACLQ3C_04355 [Gordonia sp. DT30]
MPQTTNPHEFADLIDAGRLGECTMAATVGGVMPMIAKAVLDI